MVKTVKEFLTFYWRFKFADGNRKCMQWCCLLGLTIVLLWFHFKLQKTHNANNIHLPGSFYYDCNIFPYKTMYFSPNNETVSLISGHFCGYHIAQKWTVTLKNASVLFPDKDLEMLLWKALINFAEECFEEESPFFGLAPQTCLGHNTMWVWCQVIANEQAERRRSACEVASLMPCKVLWQAEKFLIVL